MSVVKTTESVIINALPALLMQVYLDYDNWHRLFPATIAGTKFIKEENGIVTVEVNHKKAGTVINIIQVSGSNILLKEFKPLYNAIFINRFIAENHKTRYTVEATIYLKGIFKIAAPFIKGLVKKRIRNYVLLPMKQFVENNE